MYYTRFCYSNNINILYTISIIHVFILQYDISVYNIKRRERNARPRHEAADVCMLNQYI